ncbi:MAG: hypothetical protein PHT02_00710 [Tissierellia bacterium]|nr:hypothetical protein [Tissierellia bacterium]
MGYMTTITILNDAWNVIKANPEQFIKNIDMGMNGINKYNGCDRKRINSYSIDGHSAMKVAISNHADDFRLYLVGQNMMTSFGYVNDIKDLELRKDLLKTTKRLIKDEEQIIKGIENKNK